MKKRLASLLLMMMLGGGIASADNPNLYHKSGNDRFSIKIQPFLGTYMTPSSNMKEINPSSPTGIDFGIEFPSSQQCPWQQYLGNPTVGLGVSYLDFGHKTMGKAIAMYPYISIYGIRSEHFNLKFKFGAGIAAVTETFYTTQDEPVPTRTFSTPINAYLTPSVALEIPITRNFAINGEFGFLHMSNGRMVEPNKGANILFAGVGLVSTFNPAPEDELTPIEFPDLPYKWSFNITLGGGVHAADESDPHRFPVATFHTGAIYHVNNWYGVGIGADLFYNDAIANPETNRGMYIKTEEDWKRMRGGLSWNNEFNFGAVTALVNWGVYLFNPVRNLYDADHPDYGRGPRPLFYKSYEVGVEEAFHYIQFGARVRIFDNVHFQVICKTHMHIAEFMEFGISYKIPYISKGKRSGGKSIFHHRAGWWEEYQ